LSFIRIRFLMVRRTTRNFSALDFPQACVKPRKSKVSGLPFPRSRLICLGKSAKANQARLVRVHLEPEAFETLLEVGPESDRVGLLLEAHHEVVSVADDDYFAARVSLPPLLYPQVERVVQVNVRKERRDCRALWRSFFRC
jgi:hypothetical protein